MEVAEFSSARGIESQPDFVWWVPYTLRKRDRIISELIARTKGYPKSMMSNCHLQFKKRMISTRKTLISYGMMPYERIRRTLKCPFTYDLMENLLQFTIIYQVDIIYLM